MDTKYVYYAQNLTLEHIDRVNVCLTAEDHLEIHVKLRDIIGTLRLSNFESQAFAEKMFRLGYLAAQITLRQ